MCQRMLLAALLVACIPAAGLAQDDAFKKLSIKVVPEKASYLPLEPVRLLVTIENKTGFEVMGPPHVFARTALQVFVAKADGEFQPYHSVLVPWGSPPEGSKKLPHGWKEQGPVTVFYKTTREGKAPIRLFDEPGRYRCKVRFSNGDSEVFSEAVDVQIAAPSSGADVLALQALRDQELDRYLSDEGAGRDCEPAVIAKIERVLQTAPGCAYETYLCFGMGAILFKKSIPGGNDTDFDVEGLRKAARWFASASQAKDHPFETDIAQYAAKACYYLRDTKVARSYVKMVAAKGGDRLKAWCVEMERQLEVVEASGLSK